MSVEHPRLSADVQQHSRMASAPAPDYGVGEAAVLLGKILVVTGPASMDHTDGVC